MVALVALLGCRAEPPQRAAENGSVSAVSRPDSIALALEGTYALADIGGTPLPALVENLGECRVEIIAADLRVEAGRFAYQNRVREVCGNDPSEPVPQSAGGTYTVVGTEISFLTDLGSAFSAARGTVDGHTMTWDQIEIGDRNHPIRWTFRRQNLPPAPSPDTGAHPRSH